MSAQSPRLVSGSAGDGSPTHRAKDQQICPMIANFQGCEQNF
jgi:hypothetical protein